MSELTARQEEYLDALPQPSYQAWADAVGASESSAEEMRRRLTDENDDIEAAREQALESLEDMEHDDDHEAYSAGWIDACVMMDRILTDPEYFGLQEDSDE